MQFEDGITEVERKTLKIWPFPGCISFIAFALLVIMALILREAGIIGVVIGTIFLIIAILLPPAIFLIGGFNMLRAMGTFYGKCPYCGNEVGPKYTKEFDCPSCGNHIFINYDKLYTSETYQKMN